jgi:hypothetical protein
MEAKELRIGNYCKEITHSKNGIVKVSKRHFEEIEDNQIDLFPIPLTEEWLLKFGFKRNSCIKIGYSIGSVPQIDYYDGCIQVVTYCIDGEVTIELDHIKHVHQLQNLYFALTNKELISK